ncbi:hypothetical protein PHLCEN_2v13436 [Hermanssonia centrifuga]|uniref:FAD/NAD(P)-binding domain-containing protein n=1 Tax=Hermanssonia centrifuga TaxID=98765 RepID=A0A2R6NEE2_9APHY|nr:hypothetical protein PHLCEN_2v13436 [Hermanssonia centrifuga]
MSTSKKSDDKKNVVVVGGGYAGVHTAKALAKTLDPSKYNTVIITSKPYYVFLIAGLRIAVSPTETLEDIAFIPYDKLQGINVKIGTVHSIEETAPGKGGEVVLKDGEKVPYSALVLATGSTWTGPVAYGDTDEEIRATVAKWRKRFADAKHVVIAGGGAVGIELTGEIKDYYPQCKVTLVQGSSMLLNDTYPTKFRKAIEGKVRSRNVDIIFNDYIDTFPEPGDVGVSTRGQNELSDADLVVPCFGSHPNTAFISSLGSDVLTKSGSVKVKPTLELQDHPGVFAAGDIIDWKEQKQAGKAPNHAGIVAPNVVSFLAGTTQKKVYKGSIEMIIIPVGKYVGGGYFDILWGITVGNWLSSFIKGKTLIVPLARSLMNYN